VGGARCDLAAAGRVIPQLFRLVSRARQPAPSRRRAVGESLAVALRASSTRGPSAVQSGGAIVASAQQHSRPLHAGGLAVAIAGTLCAVAGDDSALAAGSPAGCCAAAGTASARGSRAAAAARGGRASAGRGGGAAAARIGATAAATAPPLGRRDADAALRPRRPASAHRRHLGHVHCRAPRSPQAHQVDAPSRFLA